MSKFTAPYFFLSICLLFISTFTQANPLTQSDINSYLNSFEQLKTSNNPMVRKLVESMKSDNSFKLDTDESGDITIATQVVNSLTGEQKNVLGKIADNSGFSSLDDWADTADKIVAAMMAYEMSKEEEDMDMSDLSPEMLAMMPPQMREQMEGVLRLMNALKDVPEQDIRLIKANYEKLTRLMDD